MKQARKRLSVLETDQAARSGSGCDTCRAWPGIVIVDDDGVTSRPMQCPGCGRDVPAFRLIHIVGVPLEAP